MTWNWQKPDWPHFTWDRDAIAPLEAQFQKQAGILVGSVKHLGQDNQDRLIVEMLTDEAIKTSEIENEFLNRDSVQSSIQRNLGLATDPRRIPPAERGIAEMMVDLCQNFSAPLSDTSLFGWHKMITSGRNDLIDIGRYRTDPQPMQVVSGAIGNPRVHFEAPPPERLSAEMDAFLKWVQKTAPGQKGALPALTRAAIAHLYFVCIHPFEDGNGRIARAIAEKMLAQDLNEPSLIALSLIITKNKKAYYDALELNNKDSEITHWIAYFAQTLLDAQAHTQKIADFLIEKTKFWDRMRGRMNERQTKAIERMFAAGVDGFTGGMSAEKYVTITDTSRATATRDLTELVEMGALNKTGTLKGTRYSLKICVGS